MKNKSWIIIVIMGIALTISIGYSIVLSNKKAEKESTVTTTSIIEMTATTVLYSTIPLLYDVVDRVIESCSTPLRYSAD